MIISGYQGIGKSTFCKTQNNCIDLESGCFWINGGRYRYPDWYKMYVNIAIDLSKQGNIVFVSCHKDVRNELSRFNNEEDIYVICPSLELEDEWIKKLKERYYFSNLEKDKKAYIAAENFYKDNIRDILTGKLKCIQITEMSYDLRNIILDLKVNRNKY